MGSWDQRVHIKICGQTTLADATLSAQAGADMIGVILFPGSKRFVPWTDAKAWIGQVPAGIERVAVFVDPPLDEVRAALADGLFHTAQLHGQEDAAFFAALNDTGFAGRLIKAVRVTDETSLAALDAIPTRRFLLDGPEPGSGHTFDWTLAAAAVAGHPEATFLLAGGLTPDNVAAAIRAVRPHGVDVASGVEARPGVKDTARLKAFIAAAREIAP
jgi:phosphoribosylanthranilate isomerase